MLLIFKHRASAHLNLRMARPENTQKSVTTKTRRMEKATRETNVCHISKGFNRLDAVRRFIFGKYCVEFTRKAEALNYKNG
jgi:hypothetical protein